MADRTPTPWDWVDASWVLFLCHSRQLKETRFGRAEILFVDQGMGREKDPFYEGDGGGKLLRGGYAIRIAERVGDFQK